MKKIHEMLIKFAATIVLIPRIVKMIPLVIKDSVEDFRTDVHFEVEKRLDRI